MTEEEKVLKTLILKWLDQQMTDDEIMRLWLLIDQRERQGALTNALDELYRELPDAPYFSAAQKDRLFERSLCPPASSAALGPATGNISEVPESLMKFPDHGKRASGSRTRRRLLGAAAVVLFLTGICFFFHLTDALHPKAVRQWVGQDVAPPRDNKIILNLGSHSQTLALNREKTGIIAEQEGVKVVRNQDGSITYKGSGDPSVFHTLTLPKGSRPVQLQLGDGTKVWLNAASSLRFPVNFKEKTRKVFLTGEAYFEVAHRSGQPFVVYEGPSVIKVLGTHFNVNGYPDEPNSRVTLLEGRVAINGTLNISPGQQAIIEPGQIRVDPHADLNEVMAWKNNKFIFNRADVPRILRQLSRWYNLQIIYSGKIPEGHYSGLINKDNRLSQVLKIMEAGGLRFKIDGNRLTVL